MANAPRPDSTLEFHVRAPARGWVSSALVRRVQVGDFVRLAAPMGSMTLDRRSTRDIVCVAGGTGLAPIKALVEELTRYNRTRWVHVFFGARNRDDLYDLPALNRLAGRYPWLSVVPACSDDPTFPASRARSPRWSPGTGRGTTTTSSSPVRRRWCGRRCARWPVWPHRRRASATTRSPTPEADS